MSQNFLEKAFGLNIKVPERTIEQGKKTLTKTFEGLFNPFGEYFEENIKVFNGDVYSEIQKYDNLCFNIGSQLRMADKNAASSFDTNA